MNHYSEIGDQNSDDLHPTILISVFKSIYKGEKNEEN
jgi:hypothetical protein